jgi:hypothetical protein
MPVEKDRGRAPLHAVSGGQRRPYAQPRLVSYGSVVKLSQGNGTLSADGGSAQRKR